RTTGLEVARLIRRLSVPDPAGLAVQHPAPSTAERVDLAAIVDAWAEYGAVLRLVEDVAGDVLIVILADHQAGMDAEHVVVGIRRDVERAIGRQIPVEGTNPEDVDVDVLPVPGRHGPVMTDPVVEVEAAEVQAAVEDDLLPPERQVEIGLADILQLDIP